MSGEYSYSVAACNAPENCSAYTVGAVVTVTLPVSLTVPTGLRACDMVGGHPVGCVPAGDTLELTGPSSYRIEWNPVANATSYQFQRTVSTASNQNPVTEPAQTVYVTYVEGGGNPVSDGGWYEHQYRIRACAGANCSAWTLPEAKVRVDANPARVAATGTVYYHTDALGSPVAQSDASGAVVKRMAWQPWGVPASGSYEQGPGYTGHVTDALTGLSYMQQRYYDPVAARFLSTDPVASNMTDGSNFNRYYYAANNPYKFTDPDGRFINFAIGFVVGFTLDAGIQYARTGEVNLGQSLVSGLAGSLTGGIGGALTKAVGTGAISASTATAGTALTGAVAGNLSTAATATVTGQQLTGAQLAAGTAIGMVTSATGAAAANTNAATTGALARMSNAPINSPAGIGANISNTTAGAARSNAAAQGSAAAVSNVANEAAGKVLDTTVNNALTERRR